MERSSRLKPRQRERRGFRRGRLCQIQDPSIHPCSDRPSPPMSGGSPPESQDCHKVLATPNQSLLQCTQPRLAPDLAPSPSHAVGAPLAFV
ncbi:hypothetical protein NDU88_001294 [Pleurodeles waltl]|uniref:Uncharacterized protein n=1 Tax=Pleurodeles waltl TaxID=8319 RepID=A0AAV7V7D8_PLEWA|nr:hypothetical protein NDU88_001294 [Pleurodeles waltl]